MGYSSYAKAMASTAMGWVTWAIGQSSTAMGEWATASGYSSTAMGEYTTASGDFSTAMGNNTTAPSGSETAIGAWNTTYTPISKTGWNASDRLFVIGNGTSSAATSNAVTVLKNGKVGIGTSTPQYPLEVVPVPVLGTTAGNTVSWERLYGFSSNSDQLRLFHRRYSSGSDWTSAEIRIQKTVDITDMGYISFKANYLEFGNGTTPQFTITNSGNVGIGTTNPGTKLAIVGLTGSATGSTLIINGNNVYYLTSKKDSKKDIEPLADNFDKILQAQPVSFSDKATGMKGIGYIAEDFEKEGLQNLLVYENGKLVSLRYDLISVYNLEIIKEQQKQIDSYKLQLESLNEKVKQIESQQKEIDELKTLVNTLVANQTGQGNK
jgi:hypothetical protein